MTPPATHELDAGYRTPVGGVERVRIRLRRVRSSPDFATLYAAAGLAGIVTGYVLTLVA
jgi:hypothetical protein